MGADIHFYVEKKQADGTWAAQAEEVPNTYYKPETAPAPGERDEDGERAVDVISDWYSGRNYSLFAILADVRNGYGFAGVDTGDPVVPIDAPRGLPDDVSRTIHQQSEYWGVDGHSHSHFTVRELIDADWQQQIVKRGWVGPEEFYRWDKFKSSPKSWSGGISGRQVEHVSNAGMRSAIEELAVCTSWTRRKYEEKHPGVELVKDQFEGDWHVKSGADPVSTLLLQRKLYTNIEWSETWASVVGDFLETILRMAHLADGDLDSVRAVFWFDN